MWKNIPPKGQHHQKTKNNPWGCLFARSVLLKEKEIYELSNNEDFSFVKIAKIGKLVVYFHFLILVM